MSTEKDAPLIPNIPQKILELPGIIKILDPICGSYDFVAS